MVLNTKETHHQARDETNNHTANHVASKTIVERISQTGFTFATLHPKFHPQKCCGQNHHDKQGNGFVHGTTHRHFTFVGRRASTVESLF
jgi:hypothetical protein